MAKVEVLGMLEDVDVEKCLNCLETKKVACVSKVGGEEKVHESHV
jgi:hypothetical protein